MGVQSQLKAEQVIATIEQLDPLEKSKVRKYFLDEYPAMSAVDLQPAPPTKTGPQYTFFKVRHLLRDVQGAISRDVIHDREDRI